MVITAIFKVRVYLPGNVRNGMDELLPAASLTNGYAYTSTLVTLVTLVTLEPLWVATRAVQTSPRLHTTDATPSCQRNQLNV